jgi:ankyrin repeat protein
VFCQLEVLRHSFPPSVRHILEELPDSLDETYERILKEIRKPNQGLAHRLMQCLVVAVRPLHVKELAEVLAFDFNTEGIPKLNQHWRWEDQEEAVMSACSSLVAIVKDGDSRIVQFSHFSVKEFLTADRLAEPVRDVSRYHIELEAAHTILAQACIGVLLRPDDHVDRDNIKEFPLAPYAGEYWPRHAKFGSVSGRIKDGMECLFDEDKPHFATWLWISTLMSTVRPKKPAAVPLYHAAKLGFRDLAAHLIAEHPEHVNARTDSKNTAIHAAAERGNTDIVLLLLEHDADVDSRAKSGWTPLHLAAQYGTLCVGKCLVDHGADIHARDVDGWTPLFVCVSFARSEEHVEFAQLLLERGAAVDARTKLRRTSLHKAVEEGNILVARLLLEHGADVNACDESGLTPSRLTTKQNILELLSEYGAKSVK